MKLSATIITLNEERNVARAMESLRCCDEIVVVDSGSSDSTSKIVRKLGGRFVENPWPGYAKQKNLAADCASNDWILSIDADEALSEALDAEILELKNAAAACHAYSMPRLAQYLGRWILHSGWYPDRKVRLYDRRKAHWFGEFVHESVHVEGATGRLQSNLLHFTCDSLSDHLKTIDRYTTLAAQELQARNGRISSAKLVFDPGWTFIRTYLIQRGFLDGVQGLIIAYMAALYTFVKYAKTRT